MSENLSTRAQLVALFNEALAQQTGEEADYTEEDVTFGEPELYDPSVLDLDQPTARNSRLLVQVAPEEEEGDEEPQSIEMMLHYNRLDCGRLAALLSNPVELEEGVDSTHGALGALSAVFGIEMLEEDFEDAAIEDSVLTLTAATASLGYIGSVQIPVEVPGEEEEPEPEPAELAGLSATHTVEGGLATVSLGVIIDGGVDATVSNFSVDMTFEGMTFGAPVNVPDGFSLSGEEGESSVTLSIDPGLNPAEYTIEFTTVGDDGVQHASAEFSGNDLEATLNVEFFLA